MDNLGQFKQTYFDECAELLAIAEAGLLRLAPGTFDLEEVNTVFRAVHSIKGGAGAFGFSDLVTFAHEYEAVMDAIRAHTVPVSYGLVEALIHANDALGRLIDHARAGTAPPPDLIAAAVTALRADSGHGLPAAVIASGRAPAVASTAAAPESPRRSFALRFEPNPDLLLSGNEPSFMFRALARLGKLELGCQFDALPALTELDGEKLYLKWAGTLQTAASLAEIEEVFEFVADDSVIEITPLAAGGAPAAAVPAPATPMRSAAPGTVAPPGPPAKPPGPPVLYGSRDEPPATPVQAETGEPVQAASGGQSIRVDLDKVERLVNLVGEMVITQSMIAEHLRHLPPGQHREMLTGLEQLTQHTRDLRECVMAIRAQPVGSVFQRIPRLVRELSAETGKDVVLVTSGEHTEVDKTVVENLIDPLTHMIRNAVAHGFEPPDEREALGKPRTGTLHLSARHRSGRIVIEVADDGRGIDRRRVLERAVERGLVPPGVQPGDAEVDDLIFLPGFTTSEMVSSLSGRGVGMDVVRRNVVALGGRIGVHSIPGEGTRFVLSLPLTLAVLDGMVVSVGAERFVVPITNIVESLRPRPADLRRLVNLCDVIQFRGQFVRLARLHRLFDIPDAVEDPTRALVVVVEAEDGAQLGVLVDDIQGQQQVVIKSLEPNFRRITGVAAATILGDGRVALILDVAGVHELSRRAGPGGGRLAVEPPSQTEAAA